MLLRYQLRTLFSLYHALALLLLVTLLLFWPVEEPAARSLLQWLLRRSELLGPPLLVALTSGLLLVDGQLDERWGTAPTGLKGLWLQRWLLMLLYFLVALGLALGLTHWRLEGNFLLWRTLLSTLVSSLFFSALPPLLQVRFGSIPAGWSGGLGLYILLLLPTLFWYPPDSPYQLWLPFAGVSTAGSASLVISKLGYGLLAIALLWVGWRGLERPERLIRGD